MNRNPYSARLAWKILAIFVLLQLCFTFLTIYRGLGFDEAIWQYIGRNWFRNGLPPYRGGVDNKSPLMFALYGFSDTLFGVNFWFARLIAIAAQTLGIFYLWRIATWVNGSRAGFMAMLIYGLSLLWHSVEGKNLSLTQTYEVTLSMVALYAFFRATKSSTFFLCGMLAGLGVAFRLSGMVMVAVIFLAMLRRRKKTGTYAAGVLVSMVVYFFLILIAGIPMGDFIQYGLLENFAQGGVSSHPLAWKLNQFASQFLFSGIAIFYPFLIAYILLKKRVDLFLLWLIFGFLGIAAIGMFAHTHLRELLPPLAIISGFVANWALERCPLRDWQAILVLIIIFLPSFSEPVLAVKSILSKQIVVRSPAGNEEDKEQLGLWIKRHTAATQKVYIAGYSAQAQAYAERLSPSIYFNVTQTPAAKKQLFSDLDHDKPELIAVPGFPGYRNLVDQDIRDFVDDMVAKDYRFDTTAFQYHIFRIQH